MTSAKDSAARTISRLQADKKRLEEDLRRTRNVGRIAMHDATTAHDFAAALGYGAACANAFLKAGHITSAQLVLDAVRSATVTDLRDKVAREMAAIEREADASSKDGSG